MSVVPSSSPESMHRACSSRIMAPLITFEGGEGAGKSSQMARLAETLQSRGHELIITREPGGCPFAEQMRHWLVCGAPDAITLKTELLLMIAARLEHVRQVIYPALQQGVWVLCDRFIESTLAYQGYGRGLDRTMVQQLHNWALEGEGVLNPDLTLLLDVPAAVGLARVESRVQNTDVTMVVEDRFERETLAFHQRVEAGFHALAAAAPARIHRIDATLDPQQVGAQIWQKVCDAFPNT